MTTPAAVLDRLLPDLSDLPENEERAAARRWLDAHGLPTERDEEWRYTPVKEVVAALGSAVPAEPRALPRAVVDDLAGVHGNVRAVSVNSVLTPELCDLRALPDGLRCGPMTAADRMLFAGSDADHSGIEGFQVLNRAARHETVVIHVAPGVEITDPIHIVHLAAPSGDQVSSSHPATVVIAERGSTLHVIETYTGLPGSAFINAVTRIRVAAGAKLRHHRIQVEGADAIHLGHTRVDQDADSEYVTTSVMLGAAIARSATDLRLHGPDSYADLAGVYAPVGHQRHDTVVSVDHRASRCTSIQRFKGVADDRGRGSFNGRIIVRPSTVGTNARQSNRALLLSPTAQVDSRPWLEIFADDVRCAHGSTTGRLDDDALFYLRTRGIPLDKARSMLVDAFLQAIVSAIAPPSLRGRVNAALTARSRSVDR